MDDIFEKISDSELEVMHVLWEAEDALPITDIRTTLKESMGWEATTVKTLVSRLLTKGAVRQEKRSVFYYFPLITERDYNEWATARLVKRLYRGKAKNLIAALVNSDGMTTEDIDELRAMFRGDGK